MLIFQDNLQNLQKYCKCLTLQNCNHHYILVIIIILLYCHHDPHKKSGELGYNLQFYVNLIHEKEGCRPPVPLGTTAVNITRIVFFVNWSNVDFLKQIPVTLIFQVSGCCTCVSSSSTECKYIEDLNPNIDCMKEVYLLVRRVFTPKRTWPVSYMSAIIVWKIN